MLAFQSEDLTAEISEDLGVDATGLEQSVCDDGETLRSSDLVPDHIIVSGAIYDMQSGELREVVRS